jgi:hypothetical protein
MRRRRRILKVVLGVLLVAAVALIYAAWPGSSTFTVSPETTYVIGPLDKHGYVDYVTALNERLSKGITPENNANVLLWKALGPHPEGATMPPEYFKWLGIEQPPEDGDYLVSLEAHLKHDVGVESSAKQTEYYDRLHQSSKWPWAVESEPVLAAYLRRNENGLTKLIDATKLRSYYNPLVPKRTEDWSPGLLESLLPNVQKCREWAVALISRAMLRLNERKIDEAWQDLLAAHRLGRLVAHGGTLVELLIGIALDQLASNAEITFLSHTERRSSKQIMAYLAELHSLPAMPTVAEKIDLGERFFVLDLIMNFARQGTPFLQNLSGSGNVPQANRGFRSRLFTYSVDLDPAFRNANRWYDRCAATARLRDRSARELESAVIASKLTDLKWDALHTWLIERQFLGPKTRGEKIGNLFISLLLPSFHKLQDSAERFEQWQRSLQLAFALAAFRADHGRFPAKLDELAPKYLEKIPDDLFSGKPLIYRLEGKGYVFYSVGPNELDEEGRGSDDTPRGDDISVRMPVPEPKDKDD